jgi:nucleoside-diphosphate-sugar epimerase
MKKNILVLGAGGFIGSNLTKRLMDQGHHVHGVDLKYPEFSDAKADEFTFADLRDPTHVNLVIQDDIDELYQLAADMGGAGYVFSGENDADIFHNSALINLNVAYYAAKKRVKKVFFSSSACIYPQHLQTKEGANSLSEGMAWPANPDSSYGLEKLMSERLYMDYHRNYNLDVRIARFHNIMGPGGSFFNGKEKAPAALCRKVAMAREGGEIKIWGSGNQVRSFLYIDDCLDGVLKLMYDDRKYHSPLNIGSEEAISINDLAKMIIEISGKDVSIKNINGPIGVAGRTSNNDLVKSVLMWEPKIELREGVEKLYSWIKEELSKLSISYERNPETGKIRSYVTIPDKRTGKVKRYNLD